MRAISVNSKLATNVYRALLWVENRNLKNFKRPVLCIVGTEFVIVLPNVKLVFYFTFFMHKLPNLSNSSGSLEIN